MRKSKTKEKIYTVAVILFMIDQFIKFFIRSKMSIMDEITIIPHFFSIYYIENQGAAFSILSDQTLFLVFIGLGCLFLLDRYISQNLFSKKQIIFMGMVMGGMLGNLIDRILYHGVVDYLSFQFFNYSFPVFNFADICITIGIILFLISYFWEEFQKNQKKK